MSGLIHGGYALWKTAAFQIRFFGVWIGWTVLASDMGHHGRRTCTISRSIQLTKMNESTLSIMIRIGGQLLDSLSLVHNWAWNDPSASLLKLTLGRSVLSVSCT
ncbi:hypothetical protein CONLIGDRAFT_32626 [Coniochaeta ligniaria NRRL 30616]|uniref:Uncharacterized protein n=1 Tax=Coniochaeta ligniaria NRRL 30616 TaxID=1408157 RepID=A0A1J7JNJ3_9PEZI|nr:hypothetical protein CONLIGDRAFT_32626 [Coniochaeta ligniaria NRRL 30616]